MSKNHKNYSEMQVVSQLTKKSDITISGKKILINTSVNQKGDIGNKSKGKIDFLVKNHGYFVTAA